MDQNQYVLNKNNNTVNLQKNSDGTFTVIYLNPSTTGDGSTVEVRNNIDLPTLYTQRTTQQNNLSNTNQLIQDLESL